MIPEEEDLNARINEQQKHTWVNLNKKGWYKTMIIMFHLCN